jgi:hypothetical protein
VQSHAPEDHRITAHTWAKSYACGRGKAYFRRPTGVSVCTAHPRILKHCRLRSSL